MNVLASDAQPPSPVTRCDVLVIEDDPGVRSALEKILARDGYLTMSAGSIQQAMKLIDSYEPNIALLDLSLPDGDGVQQIKVMKSAGVSKIIVVSGTDDVEKTHRCLTAGVFDFIVKPARSADVLRSIHRADAGRRKEAVTREEYPPQLKPGFGALEGRSRIGNELMMTIKSIAQQSPIRALITGQPGVMKTDSAALIHHYSARSGLALLIHCASENDENSQTRFFGSRATTSGSGNEIDMPGYLGKADQGTLVLDDLSALPLSIQQNLAEFIACGEIGDVNALRSISSDCSIIGILREPARQALARDVLYEPLYNALRSSSLIVPPLVDRRDDIELFARLAVDQLNEVFDTEKGLSAELLKQLKSYFWPGNLIELKKCLLTAYRETEPGEDIMNISFLGGSRNTLEEEKIAPFVGQTFKQVEAQLIKATLEACGGNKGHSAKVLGISLKTLYNRLNTIGI